MPQKVFVIPARGGSKSIPKKNIALLNGQPLIYFTLYSLFQLNDIANSIVICSTDSCEIASIARDIYPDIIIHSVKRNMQLMTVLCIPLSLTLLVN